MDPTHFLASHDLKLSHFETAQQAQIDAFYEEHGYEPFAFIARLQRKLGAAALYVRRAIRVTAGFAMRRRKV